MKSKLTVYQKELKKLNERLSELLDKFSEYASKPVKEYEAYMTDVKSLEYKVYALEKNIKDLDWQK